MNSTHYRDLWYAFLSSILLILVSFTPIDSALRDRFSKIVTPVQYGFFTLSSRVSEEVRFARSIFQLKEKAGQLEKDNTDLRSQIAVLEESLRENRIVSDQIKVDRPESELILAHVVGRGPEESGAVVKIDKGSESGVTDGATVVFMEYLIGKVTEVRPGYSFVRLVTDSQLRVAALDKDSSNRARGVVRGEFSTLMVMEKVFQEEVVKIGDTIITSGEDGFFPRGLVLGFVTEIPPSPKGILKRVKLESRVDLLHLEEVFIVKGTSL